MRTTIRPRTLIDPDHCYRAVRVHRGAWVLHLCTAGGANDATFDERLPAYVRRTLADDLGPLHQFTPSGAPVCVYVTRGARIEWQALGGRVQRPTGPTLTALLAGPAPGYWPSRDAVPA